MSHWKSNELTYRNENGENQKAAVAETHSYTQSMLTAAEKEFDNGTNVGPPTRLAINARVVESK